MYIVYDNIKNEPVKHSDIEVIYSPIRDNDPKLCV